MGIEAAKRDKKRHLIDTSRTQNRRGKPHSTHAASPLRFHREREGRGNRLRLLWRPIHGPRADDDVAER